MAALVPAMAALCPGCGGGDRGAARTTASRPAPRPTGSSAVDPPPAPLPTGSEAAAGEPTTAPRAGVAGLAGADEAAAPPPAGEPPDYTELKARIVQGDNSLRSLKALQKLGGKYQKNEEIPYLLGQLYFEKLWVGDGIKSFRRAIALQPLYRANSYVIKAAIAGLGNDRDHAQVRRFLVQDIGAPAAPYVEEVPSVGESPALFPQSLISDEPPREKFHPAARGARGQIDPAWLSAVPRLHCLAQHDVVRTNGEYISRTAAEDA